MTKLSIAPRWLLVGALTLSGIACGDDEPPPDDDMEMDDGSMPMETPDAGEDAGQDAGQDAGEDAGQDAGEDAGQDAGEDAGQDAGQDAGDSGPDCSGVSNLCTAADISCDGTDLVTCAAVDGCLVETVIDCTTDSNNFCDDSLDTPACGFNPCLEVSDPCTDVGASCDGSELVTCAADDDGCLVETTTDCTTDSNNFCDDSEQTAVCAFDPCLEVENPCDTPSAACEGVELVVCEEDDDGCLVETTTDCTTVDDNNYCDASGTPACAFDMCKDENGVDKEDVCVENETICADDVLVECIPDAQGCPIATPTDCTMDGDNNTCDPDTVPPQCDYDPCLEVENPCFPEGVECDGNDLVTCGLDENECLVETRADCTEEGAGFVCDESMEMCVACVSDEECESQAEGDTLCLENRRIHCTDTDENGCLEAVAEACGEQFTCCTGLDTPEAGCPDGLAEATCVYTAETTCDEEVAMVFDAPASFADLTNDGAGNDFNSFPCPDPDLPFLAAAPDLLYAIDIPSQTAMTVSIVSPMDFISTGVWMLQLTECSSTTDPETEAEDSCVAISNRHLTQANETDTTARYYLVIDADNGLTGTVNTGTFGLEVDVRPLSCGDGHKDGNEQCDDGNTLPDDGCAPDCSLEENFECTQSTPSMPSVCTRRPDDGVCGNVQCDELPTAAPDEAAHCCTTAQQCGVAVAPRYGASCLRRDQEGETSDECGDAVSLYAIFFGFPFLLDGCCTPEGQCGLISPEGGGCIERTAYREAMLDGPAYAIYDDESDFEPASCTPPEE